MIITIDEVKSGKRTKIKINEKRKRKIQIINCRKIRSFAANCVSNERSVVAAQ